jgi:hypothetical protein
MVGPSRASAKKINVKSPHRPNYPSSGSTVVDETMNAGQVTYMTPQASEISGGTRVEAFNLSKSPELLKGGDNNGMAIQYIT